MSQFIEVQEEGSIYLAYSKFIRIIFLSKGYESESPRQSNLCTSKFTKTLGVKPRRKQWSIKLLIYTFSSTIVPQKDDIYGSEQLSIHKSCRVFI